MTVVTQTEGLPKNVAVQVSGCRDCWSLLLPGDGGRDSAFMRCEQVDELIQLVVELKKEVQRLRSIRECEQEIGWWSDSRVRGKGARETLSQKWWTPSPIKVGQT